MDPVPACDAGNGYDGRMGLRIASIFVIWLGGTLGAVFPVFAQKNQNLGVPAWSFFIAKFFGSGVILATAFVHLLSPAEDALRNPCLTGPITEYDWVSGIVLMVVFVMFFIELMVMRYGSFGDHDDHHSHDKHEKLEMNHGEPGKNGIGSASANDLTVVEDDDDLQPGHAGAITVVEDDDDLQPGHAGAITVRRSSQHGQHVPGDDHLGHHREHTDIEDANDPLSFESYKAQLTAIFILEFGVIFHSIFIGLTLAVSGEEFITLFIVLSFHQTFEGLGLGARLAITPWPKGKNLTPYILGIAYGFSTPIAIAVGLGVRKTYPPDSATTLITNGVFDSISAGILIYTALVELMAHEFMFSPSMRNAKISTVLSAIGLMGLGAALMALLGKWA